MYATLGLGLSLIVITVALLRSNNRRANYYERDVYAMTARTHRAYIGVSLLFTALFAAALVTTGLPTVPLLAVYALIAIFYFASFARGFGDEE